MQLTFRSEPIVFGLRAVVHLRNGIAAGSLAWCCCTYHYHWRIWGVAVQDTRFTAGLSAGFERVPGVQDGRSGEKHYTGLAHAGWLYSSVEGGQSAVEQQTSVRSVLQLKSLQL